MKLSASEYNVEVEMKYLKKTYASAAPSALGFDADGYWAVCSKDGVAQSISRTGIFRTIEPRLKDGQLMRCMTKDEAKHYMTSLEADSATVSYVLGQYPDIAQAQ